MTQTEPRFHTAQVLLSEKCEVKICDFGLARVVDESDWKLNEQRERAAPVLARRTHPNTHPAHLRTLYSQPSTLTPPHRFIPLVFFPSP